MFETMKLIVYNSQSMGESIGGRGRSPEYAPTGDEVLESRANNEKPRDTIFESFMDCINRMQSESSIRGRNMQWRQARNIIITAMAYKKYYPTFTKKLLRLQELDPDNFIPARKVFNRTIKLMNYLFIKKSGSSHF